MFNDEIRRAATKILHSLFGANAEFRSGQYEAIEATLLNKRTLVVQKTGWGKSLVYFAATKLLRDNEKGVTLVVSPLLVLMENQMEAAKKLNLKCAALNCLTKDNRTEILNQLKDGSLDLVFVTPETLFNSEVQNALKDIKIGLLVIDEAHCISDWGHDFRLDYGNLYKIIRTMPDNVPILATTATANDRVVEDLKTQLGGDVFVSRGPLTRESLAIQIIHLRDRADRYTWLKMNLNKLPGSGIIYCLTKKDCEYLSDFLNINGISAMPYHSSSDEDVNEQALSKFEKNEIKAIVATTKLGMGYDKGDIGFVIHFQMPSNVVSYYQQIGRAGRNLKKAYAILMVGEEDEDIIDYFIEEAFPTREECNSIVNALESLGGCYLGQLLKELNIRKARLQKALQFLENEGAVYEENRRYYPTVNKYVYNEELYNAITQIRIKEKEQMKQFISYGECYSKFIVNCLDDFTAKECGQCANCLHRDLISYEVTVADKEDALLFIKSLKIPIEPRLQWASTSLTKPTKIEFVNKPGICLSKYGDVGYGALVKKNKYNDEEFCDELIERSVTVLQEFLTNFGVKHITCVPSKTNYKVETFTKKLAKKLNIEFVPCLIKNNSTQQKSMENSEHQCYNALVSFSAVETDNLPKKIILVDDMVDSKWTLTVCGYRLMEKGVQEVYPFALADSGRR